MAADVFYPTIDGIIGTTGVSGVDIENGLVSAGDFTVPGVLGASPGVGVGQAIPVLINTSFTDYLQLVSSTYTANQLTFSSNGSISFPINTYTSPVNNAGVSYGTVMVENGKTFVRFKAACKLFIQSVEGSVNGLNMKISYRDYYGNMGTINAQDIIPPTGAESFYITPRCIYDLYDITFDFQEDRGLPLNIGIIPAFELPYYNLGTSANLMTINMAAKLSNTDVNNAGGLTTSYPNLLVYKTSSPEQTALWGAEITNPSNILSTPLTGISGTVRPILDFSEYIQSILNGYSDFSNYQEDMAFTCIQNVYGYGCTPPQYWLDLNAPTGTNLNQPETSGLPNYLPTVIGGDQYVEGWQSWKG